MKRSCSESKALQRAAIGDDPLALPVLDLDSAAVDREVLPSRAAAPDEKAVVAEDGGEHAPAAGIGLRRSHELPDVVGLLGREGERRVGRPVSLPLPSVDLEQEHMYPQKSV